MNEAVTKGSQTINAYNVALKSPGRVRGGRWYGGAALLEAIRLDCGAGAAGGGAVTGQGTLFQLYGTMSLSERPVLFRGRSV